ncbi:hypothetical protein L915_08810 [Phytophthora nicotianae]|uniref:Uncharacterized protein n=1 Tax=Phytophthora nicotianae TaxID=4792 RepID=W2J0K6_PHYNI|nr:hypothetical protein L915_08810 [Phytophthora nicotianae]ETL39969.1 hypothetical protein L916_08739 [Phytophthora nicotianae]
MPGLSASDLHPASLCAGDTIEYSSRISFQATREVITLRSSFTPTTI